MSNRNSRVKHLEKVIKKTRKESRDMELDVLQLHEESSKLHLKLEEQTDYIKEYTKITIAEHTKQLYAENDLLREGLRLLVEDAKITEKNHLLLMDNANMTAETLERAKKTLIGKAIFK